MDVAEEAGGREFGVVGISLSERQKKNHQADEGAQRVKVLVVQAWRPELQI